MLDFTLEGRLILPLPLWESLCPTSPRGKGKDPLPDCLRDQSLLSIRVLEKISVEASRRPQDRLGGGEGHSDPTRGQKTQPTGSREGDFSPETVFLPVPYRRELVRILCPPGSCPIYFMGEVMKGGILYEGSPSITPGLEYLSTGIQALEDLWQARLQVHRRIERSPRISTREKVTKPLGETGIVWKCIPEATYILQDCVWDNRPIPYSKTRTGRIPELVGNKQLLIVSQRDL